MVLFFFSGDIPISSPDCPECPDGALIKAINDLIGAIKELKNEVQSNVIVES